MLKLNIKVSKKYLIVFMILAFSFNSGIFIKTLDNFQTGTNKSSGTSTNDLTAVNTRNAITADTTPPAINASYYPIGNTTKNVTIQSTHPYVDNLNQTWTVNESGSSFITLYFANISTESGYDYLKIYDKNWALDYSFTGPNAVVNKSFTVYSDVVYIVLTSDVSVTYYGFLITKIGYQGIMPDQATYQQFSITKYNINYTINELNPSYYELYQNNILVANSSYLANVTLSFTFTNLTLNTNNFTLIAFDTSGNNAFVNKTFQITPYNGIPSVIFGSATLTEKVNYQSEHNYLNNENSTLTISRPGKAYISLFFDRISTYDSYYYGTDYVNIYDKNWVLQDTYYGYNTLINSSVKINSDTIYVVLTSNNDGYVDYGYSISKISYPVYNISSTSISTIKAIQSISMSVVVNETYPSYYQLFSNNLLIQNSSYYSFNNFTISFSTLQSGLNNLSIFVYNLAGRFVSDQFFITILPDTRAPIINAKFTPIKINTEKFFLESKHTYRSILNETWDITRQGAKNISLYFNEIQLDYSEYLMFYDKNWNLVTSYSGYNDIFNTWVTIDSDVVHIVLNDTYGYMYGWGFSISSLKYGSIIKASSSYYQNQLTYYSINMTINEQNPTFYEIYQNNVLHLNSSYLANNSITQDLSQFPLGVNNITIVAFDANGNSAPQQFIFSILPTPKPIFTKEPNNIVLTESNKTNTLSWIVQSMSPTYYEIWLNGLRISNANYNNNTIIYYTINFDNTYLNNGTNTIELVAYNLFTGRSINEITITVIKPYQPIIVSSTSTISGSIVQAQHTSKTSPYPFFASILGLVFSITLIKRRKNRLN